MGILNLIVGLLNLLSLGAHWRLSICLWGGMLLGLAASTQVSHEPLKWIIGAVLVVTGLVTGLRWDNSH